MNTMSDREKGKYAAAQRAVNYVQDGQIVGLGSGSTSHLFIKALAEKKYTIRCVATSQESEELAISVGLRVISPHECAALDIAVDGADAVNPQKQLIKGYGGALLREKIIAAASREYIVIIDSTKLAFDFSRQRVPVEVLPFGHTLTRLHMVNKGFDCVLRIKGAAPYCTDNGNYIYDVILPSGSAPDTAEDVLRGIPGVLETGLFFVTGVLSSLARKVIIGYEDGTTKIME